MGRHLAQLNPPTISNPEAKWQPCTQSVYVIAAGQLLTSLDFPALIPRMRTAYLVATRITFKARLYLQVQADFIQVSSLNRTTLKAYLVSLFLQL